MRHKSAALGRLLPWLAAESPDEFNAYQCAHSRNAEASLKKRPLLASFVGLGNGKDCFVGIYENLGAAPITETEFLAKPEQQRLFTAGYAHNPWRDGTLWFDLQRTNFMEELSGRLLVRWSGGRNYARLAENNEFPIVAILEDSALAEDMPEWRDLILTWNELQSLPSSWADVLRQWRGIYFIWDERDGLGYVGAAYGHDNLLGRWLNYAKTGHGQNRDLLHRDPAYFRFAILERLSPDMDADDVVRRENSWKLRLHTRTHGLNAN